MTDINTVLRYGDIIVDALEEIDYIYAYGTPEHIKELKELEKRNNLVETECDIKSIYKDVVIFHEYCHDDMKEYENYMDKEMEKIDLIEKYGYVPDWWKRENSNHVH